MGLYIIQHLYLYCILVLLSNSDKFSILSDLNVVFNGAESKNNKFNFWCKKYFKYYELICKLLCLSTSTGVLLQLLLTKIKIIKIIIIIIISHILSMKIC